MDANHDVDAAVGAEQGQPLTDYKDEPRFKRLPPAEQWRRMAAAGDVRGLLDQMGCAKPGMFNFNTFGEYLRTSLDVLAQKNPTGFAEFLHADILAAAGKLVIHGNFLLEQELQGQCANRHDRVHWAATPEFEVITSKMLALHLHVARLQQMGANTQRIVEQTRKLKLANDKAAKKSRPQSPTRRHRLTTPRQPTTPESRISGELV